MRLPPASPAAGLRLFAAWALAVAMAASAQEPTERVGTVDSEAVVLAVERVASGLDHPWGMAFLPDGRLLVTERAGELRILDRDGTLSEPLAGTPRVFAQGQGGLLDVALDPAFERNRLVYLSYAEPGEGGASTAVGRGRLEGQRIAGFEVLFRQQPKVPGPNHFGGRIVLTPDGHLYLTLGERFKFEPAQDPSNHLGSIVRIAQDGSIPQSNPFVGREDAEAAIWSYGHRNIESAALHPQKKTLWIAEMGPLGGDELNLPEPGRNYGWPVVSWGQHYDGRDIPDPPTRPDFADAVRHWTPVISPSGMLFYDGATFRAWRGDVLIGSLSREGLVRLELDGEKITGEEVIPLGARIRDVEQGPDGDIYLLTDQDDGDVWRLVPLEVATDGR